MRLLVGSRCRWWYWGHTGEAGVAGDHRVSCWRGRCIRTLTGGEPCSSGDDGVLPSSGITAKVPSSIVASACAAMLSGLAPSLDMPVATRAGQVMLTPIGVSASAMAERSATTTTACFEGAVGAAARKRRGPGQRARDQDVGWPICGQQSRHKRAQTVDDTTNVDREHPVPVGDTHLPRRTKVRTHDTGIQAHQLGVAGDFGQRLD